MSGEDSTDGVSKTRAVLEDVTNRPTKRVVSSISGGLGLKSGNGNGKTVVSENRDSHFAKQVCLGVETLVKEKCKTKFGVDIGNEGVFILKDKQACELLPPDIKIDMSQESIVSVVSQMPSETKEASEIFDGSANFVKSGKMVQSVGEVGEVSRDSCASSGSMTSSGMYKKDSDDEGRATNNIKFNNLLGQEGVSRVCSSKGEDFDARRLASNKCGSVEWSSLPKSQGSKSFELERCSALKGDGCANLNAGADLLKACSCSFCLKAAYIWSDLHYQDIKGRISAIKKSQKEASILVNKYARGKQTDIHSEGNSNKYSKLESDLTGQWRSLFHNMDDILVHETSQLQASFIMLKDLRENCKTDLERTTGMPSERY